MAEIRSNQVRGWRVVQQFTVSADNQQLTIDLPRGPHIESVMLHIGGTFNVGTLFTAVRGLAPLQLFRRVDWLINGNITLDSISGIGAYLCQGLGRYARASTLVPPASAAVGSKTINATVLFDRCMYDMVRPKDSLLKTDSNVVTNQLRVQMGALADLFTGAGAATYTALTVTVAVQDYQERSVNGKTPSPLYYIKRNEQQLTFSATGTNQPFRINTGNRLRGLIIRTENAGEGADAILSRFRVIRSGDTRMDLTEQILRDLAANSGSLAAGAGVYYIDFAASPGSKGNVKYSEFWPVPANADAQLVVDVATASTTARLITVEGVDAPAM